MKQLLACVAVAAGLAGMVAGKAADAPGVLLVGIVLGVGAVAVCSPRARPFLAVAVGVAGMAAGLADDAPGAVLLGLLVVVGTILAGVISARRRVGC